MIRTPPHVIPYQGSKRRLASDILSHINFEVNCLYEPFAGSAAITLAGAANGTAKKFVIADKFEPLAELWKLIIRQPHQLVEEYTALWNAQLDNPAEFYKEVRDLYNKEKTPAALLYLVARCVKNAVRFNANGDFNQAPDNRRLGMKPERLLREALAASKLLNGIATVKSGDFRSVLRSSGENDCVYMDPPWQGTSGKRDQRYAHVLDIDELIDELDSLNTRKVPFLLSFDGTCGDRSYGNELPQSLNLTKVDLHAGRSTQATLLGRDEITVESLYLSPSLVRKQESGRARSTKSMQHNLFRR